jgi:hypothetical protein
LRKKRGSKRSRRLENGENCCEGSWIDERLDERSDDERIDDGNGKIDVKKGCIQRSVQVESRRRSDGNELKNDDSGKLKRRPRVGEDKRKP